MGYVTKFIQSCDDTSKKGYFLKVNVSYPKYLQKIHSDLPFLSERMKIDKCQKTVCNMYDKKHYVVCIYIYT